MKLWLLIPVLVLVGCMTGCAVNDSSDVIDQAIAARIYRGSSDPSPYMSFPK
jgi:hypothetical protein